MAFSGPGAVTGAKYGSVIPGLGTSIGAVAGGIFGGGGGGGGGMGPSGMRDETAYATQDFQDIFGRAPTADELAQALPAYIDPANPHIPNKTQGRAFVAQLHQTQENTPDKIQARQNAEYQKNAPQHFDSVNQLFHGSLGRGATQDELNHFGSLLASGTTDAYQLQQFLQQQPEYTQKKDAAFRSGLSSELAGYDKETLEKTLLPAIQSNFSKQGRSVDSSAFASAAAKEAEGQTADRGRYIAGLSASEYEGSKDRAYQDYAKMIQDQQELRSSGINARYQGVQNNQTRSNTFSDFNTQAQLYNQYLARYGKRNNGLGGLIGMAGGAAVGSMGGVPGAQLGASLGGAFGQAGQNAYGGSY